MDKHQKFFSSHFNVIEICIGDWTSLVAHLVIMCVYIYIYIYMYMVRDREAWCAVVHGVVKSWT